MASSFFGIPGLTTPAAAAATTTAAGASIDTSVSGNPPSSYDYIPSNQMNPSETPSAWGITNLNSKLYTGNGGTTVPKSTNQVLAAIADHYGVQPSRKISVMQQAETALAAHLGIRNVKGQTIVGQIANKLGITALPTGGLETAGSGVWGQIAQKIGIALPTTPGQGPDQTAGIVDTANSIRLMNRDQLTTLQDKLYQAGYYDNVVRPGTTTTYTPGHLDQYTMQAWGTLLQDAANTYGQKGVKATWNDVLNTQIQSMQSQGGIESILGKVKSPVTVATESQLNIPALTAFEARLGRNPTPSEMAQFTASFDAQQTAHAADITPGSTLFPDQNAVQQVPGVASPTQAAATFAMQNDNKEYLGHQMANAGALMINALANKTLGSDPNLVSATRPL